MTEIDYTLSKKRNKRLLLRFKVCSTLIPLTINDIHFMTENGRGEVTYVVVSDGSETEYNNITTAKLEFERA
jgi:NADH:ubiquinone oxidoreductase subunit D